MEDSPLKFLDYDVSQMLNKEVKLKKEEQNSIQKSHKGNYAT